QVAGTWRNRPSLCWLWRFFVPLTRQSPRHWYWSRARMPPSPCALIRKDSLLYRITVDMRQHCTDGSFRLCRWRTHTEALSEDSGPEALSTQDQYFALHVFYQWFRQKSGGDSAVCPEFVIAGMIFHPSRVES